MTNTLDNNFSRWSVFSTKHFLEIANEFPEYIEQAAELWLRTQYLELQRLKKKESKFSERKAAYAANNSVKLFYEELKEQSLEIICQDDSSDEWSGLLADEELTNKFYSDLEKNKQKPEEKKQKRETLDRKKIFDKIEKEHPDYLDQAIGIWEQHYKNNASKSLPSGFYDNSAIQSATEKLNNFLRGLEVAKEYEEQEKKEEKLKKLSIDDYTQVIDPVIKTIEKEHPEYLDTALDHWVKHYERIAGNNDMIDETAVKIANRRLKVFYEKI